VLWFGLVGGVVVERFVAESTRSRPLKRALDYWLQAVTGHHGQPPKPKVSKPEGLFTSTDQEFGPVSPPPLRGDAAHTGS
jgi:hypothetical protein